MAARTARAFPNTGFGYIPSAAWSLKPKIMDPINAMNTPTQTVHWNRYLNAIRSTKMSSIGWMVTKTEAEAIEVK